MSDTTTPAPVAAGAGSALKLRGLVVLTATIATAIWIVADPIAGVPLKVKFGNGTQHVQAATVIVVTVLFGVVASLLVGVLERRTFKARCRWVTVGVVVLALSLLAA
jgi:hypothetical protein